MDRMIIVREVTPEQWATLRDVRLAALLDAPSAFASTYAREAPFTEEQWRGRIAARVMNFFAFADEVADGQPAGLAAVFEADGPAELVSMWVRPAARGRGVGEALISAAADWARARDHDALYLWVAQVNPAARRLYERCGFTPTGDEQPFPNDPSRLEIRMRRALLAAAVRELGADAEQPHRSPRREHS
jgi:GNAT superfamily N-acetyltransferase